MRKMQILQAEWSEQKEEKREESERENSANPLQLRCCNEEKQLI